MYYLNENVIKLYKTIEEFKKRYEAFSNGFYISTCVKNIPFVEYANAFPIIASSDSNNLLSYNVASEIFLNINEQFDKIDLTSIGVTNFNDETLVNNFPLVTLKKDYYSIKNYPEKLFYYDPKFNIKYSSLLTSLTFSHDSFVLVLSSSLEDDREEELENASSIQDIPDLLDIFDSDNDLAKDVSLYFLYERFNDQESVMKYREKILEKLSVNGIDLSLFDLDKKLKSENVLDKMSFKYMLDGKENNFILIETIGNDVTDISGEVVYDNQTYKISSEVVSDTNCQENVNLVKVVVKKDSSLTQELTFSSNISLNSDIIKFYCDIISSKGACINELFAAKQKKYKGMI